MSRSGSVSHASSVREPQTMREARSAGEYSNPATAPALRPITPRWRGPMRSWSSEWQPAQRDSYSSFPLVASAACAIPQTTNAPRKTAALGAEAERRTGKLPAEHAGERGPVHGLVGGEASGHLREVHVLERRDDAEVGVARAELEASREVEDVLLALDRGRGASRSSRSARRDGPCGATGRAPRRRAPASAAARSARRAGKR